MNKLLEKTIIDTIKNNDVREFNDWNYNSYTVVNHSGHTLIQATMSWKYNTCKINVNGKNLATVKLFSKPTNEMPADQQSAHNIINACADRVKEQKIAKRNIETEYSQVLRLKSEEREFYSFLRQNAKQH